MMNLGPLSFTKETRVYVWFQDLKELGVVLCKGPEATSVGPEALNVANVFTFCLFATNKRFHDDVLMLTSV